LEGRFEGSLEGSLEGSNEDELLFSACALEDVGANLRLHFYQLS
jgi:hypothetical protein